MQPTDKRTDSVLTSRAGMSGKSGDKRRRQRGSPFWRFAVVCMVISLLNLPESRANETAASYKPDGAPNFDPLVFFTGRTESWGVFEDRGGAPTQTIRTVTVGRAVRGALHLEQDLFFSKNPSQHRSWDLRRVDARHFEATATDIVGVARGEVHGNLFTWTFTVATKPGNPIYNVEMTQRMYLQPGGRTMINRDTIRKFGIILAGVTEEFQKK